MHLFGQRSLMFERWATPESVSGRNILMVGLELKNLTGNAVTRRFVRINEPHECDISYNGRLVRHFYYRVGYGYLP
jgi:hypothetical protein